MPVMVIVVLLMVSVVSTRMRRRRRTTTTVVAQHRRRGFQYPSTGLANRPIQLDLGDFPQSFHLYCGEEGGIGFLVLGMLKLLFQLVVFFAIVFAIFIVMEEVNKIIVVVVVREGTNIMNDMVVVSEISIEMFILSRQLSNIGFEQSFSLLLTNILNPLHIPLTSPSFLLSPRFLLHLQLFLFRAILFQFLDPLLHQHQFAARQRRRGVMLGIPPPVQHSIRHFLGIPPTSTTSTTTAYSSNATTTTTPSLSSPYPSYLFVVHRPQHPVALDPIRPSDASQYLRPQRTLFERVAFPVDIVDEEILRDGPLDQWT
mmetsp:Transcript_19430/g.36266  ORF Transcript_19430/g.36266 Transcript_19430/m.36266 type:complete len:314 (-) Transcript_19430:807-1748(-)